MKPRLFIGSSKEGLKVANAVKSFFENDFDCNIWNDGVFKLNKGTFDALLKASAFYDFAILIWTKDDKSYIRRSVFSVPRDNVIFEHGLFLGGIGSEKSFLLCDDKVKIPSDLQGITLSMFRSGGDYLNTEKFKSILLNIKESMLANVNKGYLSLLPSTSLAIGYYDNLINRVCNWIKEQGSPLNFKYNGLIYKGIHFNVLVPSTIEENMNDYVGYYCNNNNIIDIQLTLRDGGRPINVKYDSKNSDCNNLILIDIPTTLSSIKKSTNLCFPQVYVGECKDKVYVETREIENFKNVLNRLINDNSYARQYVEIELI